MKRPVKDLKAGSFVDGSTFGDASASCIGRCRIREKVASTVGVVWKIIAKARLEKSPENQWQILPVWHTPLAG